MISLLGDSYTILKTLPNNLYKLVLPQRRTGSCVMTVFDG